MRVSISRSRAIYASRQPTATFSESFAKVGLHPDWGGTYFLPRLVTPNKACEMFFLGDTIDAAEAHRLGILNFVVPPEELEAETRKLAERLRDAPAIALAAAKQAVYMSQAAELEEMLRYETEAQMRCFESQDGAEGVRAFLEKRRQSLRDGNRNAFSPKFHEFRLSFSVKVSVLRNLA